MRSRSEVDRVLRLAQRGASASQIAAVTGIPRSTVRGWLVGAVPQRRQTQELDLDGLPGAAYSYLFGLYLGDGSISSHARGVYRLRIALDSRYPGIIGSGVRATRAVLPRNRVSVQKHPTDNRVDISCYSKHWPELFPQHGPGKKHNRPILIDPWQGRIVEHHVEDLLRGLVHSDGCRVLNVVNGKAYPRYQFTNHSEDIRAIFSGACDELGIRWKQSNRCVISVSRRPDVARLDEFIGPKA